MNGNFVAGAVASGVVRNIDSTFAPLLARHAELLGHDLYYSTPNHLYNFRMQASVTNVSGDPREILLRQESSARYFSDQIAAPATAASSRTGSTRRRRR